MMEATAMTNTQLYLAIGVPFLTVLLAMMFNHVRITDMRDLLRAEIQSSRNEVLAELRGLRGILDAVMGKLDELDRRITKLEDRS
jgi:hypothetical protein